MSPDNQNKIIILSISELHKNKGIDVALKALSLLPEDKNKKIKQQALGRLEDLQHETFEMIEGIARKAGDKGYQYGGDGEDFYTLSIDVGRQFVIAENILNDIPNPESVE